MRTKIFLLLTSFLTATIALATTPKGPLTNTVYYAPDLEVRAGEILLSPNFTTMIRTWTNIDDVYYGNQDLFELKVQNNLAVLWPKLRSGTTDLIFFVAGRALKFTVKIEEKDAQPREYLVREDMPYLPTGGGGGSSAQSVQGTVSGFGNTSLSAPLARGTGSLEYQGMAAQATATTLGPSSLALNITLENKGLVDVVIDPTGAEVVQGNNLLEFMLTQLPPSSTIPPARSMAIQVEVNGVASGPLEARIPVVVQNNKYILVVSALPGPGTTTTNLRLVPSGS